MEAKPQASTETSGQVMVAGSAILRDHLATDRTIQANERTFLAYVRTALTLFVAGVTFIRFFGQPVYYYLGAAFIPLSALILVIGILRYRKMNDVIRASAEKNDRGLMPPVG